MTLTTPFPSTIDPAAAAEVRVISIEDVRSALKAGFADFLAMPTHVLFVVVIYPIIGLVIARMTLQGDLLPLAFPFAAGFALLGPFAALGTYELSRRRERGETPTWRDAAEALKSPARPAIAALGGLLLVLFFAWIATANMLYGALAGDQQVHSIGDLLRFALSTPAGWALIVLGNGLGFVFAAVAFAIGAISFPLLLDRGGSAPAALAASIRAVRASPGPMAVWAAVVAVGLALGSLPLFVGLAVVFPILGHATWHLYRRAVVPLGPAGARS